MGKGTDKLQVSPRTLDVLECLLQGPGTTLSGADLHQRIGIASATLYPILLRLEAAGWLASQWEAVDPTSAARPRRRLYRLTSAGLREASDMFATFNRGVFA